MANASSLAVLAIACPTSDASTFRCSASRATNSLLPVRGELALSAHMKERDRMITQLPSASLQRASPMRRRDRDGPMPRTPTAAFGPYLGGLSSPFNQPVALSVFSGSGPSQSNTGKCAVPRRREVAPTSAKPRNGGKSVSQPVPWRKCAASLAACPFRRKFRREELISGLVFPTRNAAVILDRTVTPWNF